MRQLLPDVADVDPVEAYLAAHRPAPDGRPWVTVGMIQSLDGATALEGRSGGLGGPADKAVFRAVRALADVVLVAGGTVRAETYGPLRHRDEILAAREAAGRRPGQPRLAVVTGSLDLDPDASMFSDAPVPPVVFTGARADPRRRERLSDVADVRTAGDERVDLVAALGMLAADGADVVVCEGGPSLNGALVDAGVVDEWCLSLGPLVAGGDSPRIVRGAAAVADPGSLHLASLLTADGLLFGRWVRPRT